MAIWQTEFNLCTQKDNIHYDKQKIQNSIKELSLSFPEEQSWCKYTQQFGNIESTCIEFHYDTLEVLHEIFVRLDLRNITNEQLQSICKFAHENFFLIEASGELFEPTIANLKRIISHSNAYKFMLDPNLFLKKIGEDRDDSMYSGETPE